MIRSMMRCSMKDFHATSHHTSLLPNFQNSFCWISNRSLVAEAVCTVTESWLVPQFSSCCDQQYNDFFGTFACFAWMCKLTVVDCIVHTADLIVFFFLLAFSTFLHFCFIDFTWILVQAIYIHLVLYKITISTYTLHWPHWPSKCAMTFPCCNYHENTVLCANRIQVMCLSMRRA